MNDKVEITSFTWAAGHTKFSAQYRITFSDRTSLYIYDESKSATETYINVAMYFKGSAPSKHAVYGTQCKAYVCDFTFEDHTKYLELAEKAIAQFKNIPWDGEGGRGFNPQCYHIPYTS